MNKVIALVAVVIVLGGGWWIYDSRGERVPIADIESTTTEQMTETPPVEDNVRQFSVSGSPFSFTPNVMSVRKGDTVKITFTNSQGLHDLVIDEFNVRTKQLPAGQSETITFVADKVGSFEYYCSVGTHRQMGMVGTLTVLE